MHIRGNLAPKQVVDLELRYELRLAKRWDRINSDSFAYAPTVLVRAGQLTEKQCEEENGRYGRLFASPFMRRALVRFAPVVQSCEAFTWKAVGLGYGRGYDADWVADAIRAGVQVHWVDVSPVSCAGAWSKILQEANSLRREGRPIWKSFDNLTIQAEVSRFLSDPSQFGINPDSVLVWYCSRIIGCLSRPAMKKTLRLMGEGLSEGADPAKQKEVIIIQALGGENAGAERVCTNSYTERQILYNLRLGAGRQIEIIDRDEYRYFNFKTVTALAIKAL